MTGIVGIDLPEAEIHRLLLAHVSAYWAAVDANPANPSLPELPDALRPAWATSITATPSDGHFWIDYNGPRVGGVQVAQDVTVKLRWSDDETTYTVKAIEVREAHVYGLDREFALSEAREVTRGMIAAGKLLASLLKPTGGE